MEYTDNELEQSIEETRQDIEEKRASMTEKLELLEERFRDTLEDTRSAVEDIVENVKGTVEDTVEVVKETVEGAKSTVDNLVENVKGTMDETATMVKKSFDLTYQIEQRPWVIFGGSVALGFMLGNWLQRGSSSQREYFDRGYHYDEEPLYRSPMRNNVSFDDLDETATGNGSVQSSGSRNQHMPDTPHGKPHRWSTLTEPFQEEWDALKGVALGTLMGTVRAMVRQHMPSVAPKLEQALNSASTKLGAEPIDLSSSQPPPHHHNGHSQSQDPLATDERSTSPATFEATNLGWQGAQGSTSPSARHKQ